jgi:surface protein
MNNTGEIVNHIINFVKNEKFNDYRFLDIGFAQPLNNYDNNRMNGWIFRTRIETKREQCYTPIEGGVVPILCADANVIVLNSDNVEVDSGTVGSGGTGTFLAPDANYLVQYVDGTLIEAGTIASGSSVTVNVPNAVICQDANYTLTDSDGNVLESGTIPSGGSATIVAPDSTFSINSTLVATIPSGSSDSIQVRKQSGSNQIGSLQGQHWRIPNSVITLEDTSNNTLSTTNVPATETATLTAPDATVENSDASYTDSVVSSGTLVLPDSQINVNGVNEGDVVSVQPINITLTDGTNPVTPESVTVVGNDVEVEVSAGAAPAGWQRPADWLTLPAVQSTDDTFVGLYAIFPSGNNFAAFRFTTNTGDYEVDWGDGTIDVVASNVVAEHTYDYSTYDPTDATLSSRGYKQAIIVVTPVSGELRTANFQFRRTTTPAQTTAYATGFLDCAVSMPFANSGASITFGGQTVRHSYCEQFEIKNSGNGTIYSQLFRECRSLQSVPFIDMTNITSISFMFANCFSLQSAPLLDTSSVTSMGDMFNGCSALQTIPLYDTSSLTNMFSMFNGCSSLQSIPLLNTSSVTTMNRMFIGCNSINEIPTLNTSNVTDMQFFATNCNSLDRTNIICPVSVAFNACQLSQAELVNIFNNLVDRSATTAANINISGNWGASALTVPERAIATLKNWTITG